MSAIAGFQVRNFITQEFWGDRPYNVVLTEHTALGDLEQARKSEHPFAWTLVVILVDEMEGRVFEEVDEDSVFELEFDALEASASQTIRITHPDFSKEAILEGLEDGRISTTMGHGGDSAKLRIVATGEVVGAVVDQDVSAQYEILSD